jgi:type I restriction enzyme S subunit
MMSNIPKGYKQTEVGVIPSDWEVKKLREILQNSKLGGNYTNSEKETSYPLIKMGNIGRGNIVLNKIEYIPEKNIPSKKDKLQYGDVLFNTRNTLDLVGKVAIWKNELHLAYYNSNLMKFEFSPANVSSNFFMNNIFNTRVLLAQLKGIATGTTSVAAIYTRDLLNVLIPLPTKAEQTAIATALSDADALIHKLEELIAKKRKIKQGAMQELLTGKKRLPGFSGEWGEKSLIELADNKKELFDDGDWIEAQYLTEDGIRLIQTGNIGEGVFLEKETKKYISQKSFEILKCKEIREGDILICRLAEPAGRACVMPNIGEDKMITAVDVSIFRPLQTMANRQYLVNVFSTNDWFIVVNEKCGGSTRTRIARGALGKIKLFLPSFPEQTAIAQVLSDMDAEIDQLEQKRDKYRMIKQGMMQELLTGKTRLI